MSDYENITSLRTTRRALVVLFFTSLFFFFSFGLDNMFNALEIPLSGTYGLSPLQMGWVSSLYFWANVVSLFPMAALVDRFSPKWVIVVCLLLASFTVWLIPNSDHVWVLVVSRTLMGVASGCCFVGCIRIAVNWFDLRKMARVSGFIITMGMLGGFMVQSPLIALMKLIGWRSSLDVVATLGVIFAICIMVFVTDCPKKLLKAYTQSKGSIPLFKGFLMVFSNPQNWLAGLSGSLINLPIGMLGALWGIPYLMKVQHLSNLQAGFVCGMLYFGTMFGCPAMGAISDLMHRRKLPLVTGIVLSIITLVVLLNWPHPSYAVLLVLFFLLGLFTSAQTIAYPIVAESNPHSIISTATGVISILMLLTSAITQPLFGWIVEAFGIVSSTGGYTAHSYSDAIGILPVAFVIAIVAALLLRETGKSKR